MAPLGPVALEVEGVSVSYGKFIAVESVTLSVGVGECVAVIGPNGHGKSSMVTAVAGLVLVPERRHLYPELTTRDNIMLGSYSRTRRIGARQAWEDVSSVLDMFPELARLLGQKAGTLSGGQQQMVAIARAMAAGPRVLLLDEPCLGLAEAVARRVYDWLSEMTSTDMTILLVEENPVHALLVADRAVRMYKGLVERPEVAA